MAAGIAYIVETRNHPNLPLVIHNADAGLPEDWQIWCFHGDENSAICKSLLKPLKRQTKVITLEKTITNLNDYNLLMLSVDFWEQFTTDNLLCFQTDTLINYHAKEKLYDLLEYDYVGAPWSDRIQQRFAYIPSLGGNGGFCFSKKQARLTALTQATTKLTLKDKDGPFHISEDVWFSLAMQELNLKLPKRDIASSLLVESVLSDNPFALHKPWGYVKTQTEKNAYAKLLEKLPELQQLEDNCQSFSHSSAKASSSQKSYRLFLLDYAREMLNAKNYSQTDLALQVCQLRYPDHPASYNLQSKLAYQLGALKQAKQFAQRSLEKNPSFKKAQENLDIISKDSNKQKSKSTNNRFLLINSWGSGFGFDLLYLLGQLLLAEITNRTPVIHWGKNSLYNQYPDAPFYNAFTDFFKPLNALTCADMQTLYPDVFPQHWQDRELNNFIRRTRWRDTSNNQRYQISYIDYLARSEKLVVSGEYNSLKMLQCWLPEEHVLFGQTTEAMYRHLFLKYLKINDNIKIQATQFIEERFADRPFLAIHLRGTDKYQEKQSTEISTVNQILIEKINQQDNELPIFLMTDDQEALNLMQKMFGDRLASTNAIRGIVNNQGGIHHQSAEKRLLGEQVLIDMLIAEQAKHFYGCGFSYLAGMINSMRPAESSTLLPFNLLNRFIDIPIQPKS